MFFVCACGKWAEKSPCAPGAAPVPNFDIFPRFGVKKIRPPPMEPPLTVRHHDICVRLILTGNYQNSVENRLEYVWEYVGNIIYGPLMEIDD